MRLYIGTFYSLGICRLIRTDLYTCLASWAYSCIMLGVQLHHAGHAIKSTPCDLSLESNQSKSSTTTLCSSA